MRELLSKNTHSSAMIIDSRTEKPIKNHEPELLIPFEERQFYYFSLPVFNIDSTLAIFCTMLDGGNYGENRINIYKKANGHWTKLTQLVGLNWMKT
jgi:hypothetical protein